jgi:hypothetical protein
MDRPLASCTRSMPSSVTCLEIAVRSSPPARPGATGNATSPSATPAATNPPHIDAIPDGELQRAPDDHLLSANDERDSREVDGSPVVREELSERPGSQSRRPDGIRMRGCAERDSDRKLVGADGVRAVPVIPAPEIAAQPVVDNRAKFLHSVKHLPGRVATLATQRDACAVPGPRGLGRRRVLILRQGGHRAARESRTQRHARAYGFCRPSREGVADVVSDLVGGFRLMTKVPSDRLPTSVAKCRIDRGSAADAPRPCRRATVDA